MALVTGGLLAAGLVMAASYPPGTARWHREIGEASRRFAIPAEWIARVIHAESGGRTKINGRPTTSPAGAMGLMQLMPETWEEVRARYRLGRDPHQPRDNILAGTAYLKEMYDRFGYPGLFAAYNAGPGTYTRHLTTGSSLPRETRSYLRRVVGRRHGRDAGQPRRANGKGAGSTPASPPETRVSPIFVPLTGAR